METDSIDNMDRDKKFRDKCRISVIVPIYNGAATIGLCLEALLASDHDSYEIIVVDDYSTDGSVDIISQYPCSLIRLPEHLGAAAARNEGARHSKGETLFFTDSDCLVFPDTLGRAERYVYKAGPGTIIGGTYTCEPFDKGFFSIFQSVFIHYSELKNSDNPDYIATHAMAMNASIFKNSGGFNERFLPILEDVEFSHRMKRQGIQLRMKPHLLVRHIFNFSLLRSMRNGYRKSKFWMGYSLANGNLLTDSGTASSELKTSVLLFHMIVLHFLGWILMPDVIPPSAILVLVFINFLVCHRMLALFYTSGGTLITLAAAVYFMFVYPLAVSAGSLSGLIARRPYNRAVN